MINKQKKRTKEKKRKRKDQHYSITTVDDFDVHTFETKSEEIVDDERGIL